MASLTNFFKNPPQTKTQILTLSIITLVIYLNIFQNQFFGDDFDFIHNWTTIHSLQNTTSLVLGDVPQPHLGTYRPIRSIAYLIIYQLANTNIFFYHSFSLLVHLTSTLTIFFIIKKLSSSKLLPFVTSLFFATHPIHTEAITFITASFDSLGITLLLLSFLFYLKPAQSKLSYLFAFLAIFTNEIAIIYPLLILAHQKFSLPKKNSSNPTKPYFFIASIYLFIRFFILDITTRGNYWGDSLFNSLQISFKAIAKYFQLYLLPTNLSFSHTIPTNIYTYTLPQFNQAAIHTQSFLQPPTLFATLFLLTLIFLIVKLKYKHPLISFSLSWLLISLIPVLNLIPTALILSERYTYLSSFGFCLLVATILVKLFTHKPTKNISVLLIIFIALFYSYLTIRQNHYWSTPITLWSQATHSTPQNPTVWWQLGQAYQTSQQLIPAQQAFQQALILNPKFAQPLFNLGVISQYQNDLETAIKYYQQSLEIDPNNQEAKQNLITSHLILSDQLLQNNQPTQAYSHLLKAQILDPISYPLNQKLTSFCSSYPTTCHN